MQMVSMCVGGAGGGGLCLYLACNSGPRPSVCCSLGVYVCLRCPLLSSSSCNSCMLAVMGMQRQGGTPRQSNAPSLHLHTHTHSLAWPPGS